MTLVSVTIDADNPNIARSVFEFTVTPQISNAGGSLHGGAVATFFDTATSMTCSAVARDGFWDAGHVTRVLSCQYLRPAREGTIMLIESEIVHLGRLLGQIRGTMRRKYDQQVCYTCTHDKVQVTKGRL